MASWNEVLRKKIFGFEFSRFWDYIQPRERFRGQPTTRCVLQVFRALLTALFHQLLQPCWCQVVLDLLVLESTNRLFWQGQQPSASVFVCGSSGVPTMGLSDGKISRFSTFENSIIGTFTFIFLTFCKIFTASTRWCNLIIFQWSSKLLLKNFQNNNSIFFFSKSIVKTVLSVLFYIILMLFLIWFFNFFIFIISAYSYKNYTQMEINVILRSHRLMSLKNSFYFRNSKRPCVSSNASLLW